VLNRRTIITRYLLRLLLAICLCGLHGFAWAESDYTLGVQAYQNNQLEKARAFWESSAADGNLSASFNLGLLLSKGLGGAADSIRAAELFRRAADAGIAVGQHNLALAYYSGNGIEKNLNQASIWWERAARQGHAQAQFNLGVLLWNGDGINKNEASAVEWFQKSSDAGNEQARAFLDTALEHKNTGLAIEPPGTPATDPNPAINSLLQQATQAYQQQDFESAYSSWLAAAESGNAAAQFQLAGLYREGRGTPKDLKRAYQYTKRSAAQNLPQAQYRLALYYLQGAQVVKNDTLALFWMQSAADQGHIKAKEYIKRLR